MGYLHQKPAGVSNTSAAEELLKCLRPELNGDNQIVISGLAADTGITSGDAVSVTPTSSGWLIDDVIADADQYIGVIQDTPQAAADRVKVCMGGFTYVNGNGSTKYATAWGSPIEFVADVPSCTGAVTSPTTNAFGWAVTSGVYSTVGNTMIFLDQPWRLIDVTTV